MVALSFTNLVFASHLYYILLEKGEYFYKERQFWELLFCQVLSIYLTLLIVYKLI